MLVDAVHAEPVEHIKRTHPLGVSFGEVVVHCHHVHAFACKCVQKYRQGCDQCLSLTGRHLRDFTFVEGDAADQLNVVMHHVPGDFVAAGHPLVVVDSLVAVDGHEVVVCGEVAVEVVGFHNDFRVLGKAAGRRLDDCKSLGKYLVQGLLDGLVLVLDEFVGFGRQLFLFGYGNVLVEFEPDFRNTVLKGLLHLAEMFAQPSRMSPQLVR